MLMLKGAHFYMKAENDSKKKKNSRTVLLNSRFISESEEVSFLSYFSYLEEF